MKHAADRTGAAFRTLAELVAWCERAPSGTRLEARELAGILIALQGGYLAQDTRDDPGAGERMDPAPSWRERLWIVPAETRLGVAEVAEALGRPKSFVYARTGPKAESPLPHRKLDGTLLFTAGELRAWIRNNEDEIHGGPIESTAAERGGFYAVR